MNITAVTERLAAVLRDADLFRQDGDLLRAVFRLVDAHRALFAACEVEGVCPPAPVTREAAAALADVEARLAGLRLARERTTPGGWRAEVA